MKSAKSRRFGPPKKHWLPKGLALSENFGLRRLVLEDCVRHQEVRASGGGSTVLEIAQEFGSLGFLARVAAIFWPPNCGARTSTAAKLAKNCLRCLN